MSPPDPTCPSCGGELLERPGATGSLPWRLRRKPDPNSLWCDVDESWIHLADWQR